MFELVLVCAAMLVGADGAASPAADDRAAYQAAAARVGRDPDAHVKLALWCEARGLDAERVRHLAMAVLTKPDHALARTLLGLVADGGKWRRPEEVARRAREDAALMAKLAAYDDRRAMAKPDADSQWKLALWCEEQGLEPEAKAHLLAVVRKDPSREAAWKRLGYKEFGGRWLPESQIAAIKAEAAAQEKANREWLPKLERLRADLKLADRREAAESALAAVTDPRAVPAVAATFAEGDPVRAVQVLGQIDAIPASRALATLAVWTPSEEARRHAVEILRQRDPREYAGLLIGMIREAPAKFETGFVAGASDGKVRRAWRLETGKEEITAVYGRPIQWITPPRLHADWVPSNPAANPWANAWAANWDPLMMGFGSSEALTSALLGTAAAMGIPGAPAGGAATPMPGGPIIRPDSAAWNHMIAQAQNAAYWRDVQIQQILAGPPTTDSILYPMHMRNFAGYLPLFAAKLAGPGTEQYRQRSQAAANVLTQVTGLDLGPDAEGWKSWYMSQLGYDYTPRPKVQPKRRYVIGFVSCFAAGTQVVTQTGRRPIEEIAVGDLVLAMDTATGALGFQPVYAVHHNPPAKTLKVELDGETVVASTFHRFWVAGRGWVMARDLKPGDPVRTLDGLRSVAGVAEEKVQPVFNLDVAEAHSFFVGAAGALVHDNTVPGPRLAAFDAPTPTPASDPEVTPTAAR